MWIDHRPLWRIAPLVAIFSISFDAAHADQFAFTQDGQKIVLKEDGTWLTTTDPDPTPSDPPFRRAHWGTTMTEVLKTESSNPAEKTKDTVAYQGKLGSHSVTYGFVFSDDRLVRGVYVFDDRHTNPNNYISDYNDVKELITKKYGSPDRDDVVWKNDLFKNKPTRYGSAIGAGHLVYQAQWETESTTITLLLFGENFELSHTLQYASKSLAPAEEAARIKLATDDL